MKVRTLGLATIALSTAVVVAACGGGGTTPAPTTPPASRAQSSNSAAGGSSLDAAGVQAAVAALKAHDSWQFKVTSYESGTPNFSRNASGTQRTVPTNAVSLAVTQSGKADKKFTLIGTDVWFDSGTGSYTQTKVSDQYVTPLFTPYYLDGIVSSAEVQGYQFNPVGADTVSGVAATHYRLDDSFILGIVANMNGMTPADWGADVWVANADGALLRLTWGPQSLDKAQLQAGIDYTVTSIDCTCPVNPPV